jgi:uncharacterized damage-inducible protein DinB
MKTIVAVGVAVSIAALTASAQTAPAGNNPYTSGAKAQAETIRSLVLRTAEKVPEEHYGFKPTPDVRSLAGVLGHIADGNNLLCGNATGAKPVFNQANEKKTTRAEIVAALKESFAACDKVFASTTDANGTAPVDLFGQKETRLGVLAFNNSHMWEHYGNLVTYMRLKNIVPPSSERSQ